MKIFKLRLIEGYACHVLGIIVLCMMLSWGFNLVKGADSVSHTGVIVAIVAAIEVCLAFAVYYRIARRRTLWHKVTYVSCIVIGLAILVWLSVSPLARCARFYTNKTKIEQANNDNIRHIGSMFAAYEVYAQNRIHRVAAIRQSGKSVPVDTLKMRLKGMLLSYSYLLLKNQMSVKASEYSKGISTVQALMLCQQSDRLYRDFYILLVQTSKLKLKGESALDFHYQLRTDDMTTYYKGVPSWRGLVLMLFTWLFVWAPFLFSFKLPTRS